MKLGFVSAIVPDLSLDEVFALAAAEGYACVELMCWPPGKADRKYAGVTHIDVTNFSDGLPNHVRLPLLPLPRFARRNPLLARRKKRFAPRKPT